MIGEQPNNEQLNNQLDQLKDRIVDEAQPDWLDMLKRILMNWQTWVALAAVGGGVVYYLTNPTPPVNNTLDNKINNQTINGGTSSDILNPRPTGDTPNPFGSIFGDLLNTDGLFQNLYLDNTTTNYTTNNTVPEPEPDNSVNQGTVNFFGGY